MWLDQPYMYHVSIFSSSNKPGDWGGAIIPTFQMS